MALKTRINQILINFGITTSLFVLTGLETPGIS